MSLMQQFVREAAGLTDEQVRDANNSLPEAVGGEMIAAILDEGLSRLAALSIHRVNIMTNWESEHPEGSDLAEKARFQRQTEILVRWTWEEIEYAYDGISGNHSLRRGWKVITPSK